MPDGTVRGIVHLIEPTKSYGQKGFRKRLVVLEQDFGQFTNYVPVEFTRDDCNSVDQMAVGVEVEISFNLKGRKWQKTPSDDVRFFISAEATGFKFLGDVPPRNSSQQPAASTQQANTTQASDQPNEDDIPF